MKVLVTGGAGFIGLSVVKLLLETGHQVKVLDNLSTGHQDLLDKRADLLIGDIGNDQIAKTALKDIDAVIHLAGLIIVPESVVDPIRYCQNNVIGTVSFLESMRKAHVKKIIFSSSACVYGSPDKLPIRENAPVRPDNPYGATKASIESFLQVYHSTFDFDVTILRYFNPYGPGEFHQPETHAIPNFIAGALKKESIPLYWKGEQIRDFIYIDDLVKAHLTVLKLSGFHIFNLGTETGIKIKDVISHIFEIVGYEVPINNLGQRQGDVFANYASGQKIRKELSWKAKINLKEGLKYTIDFYKKSLQKDQGYS